MKKGYSVTVSKWGEPIVTIDHEMLSGKGELSEEELEAIRDAGDHLKSFAGPTDFRCFVCGGNSTCADDCPLHDLDARATLQGEKD